MKYLLNKNLFKVNYNNIEEYVIIEDKLPLIGEWYYNKKSKEIHKRNLPNTEYIECFKIIAASFPLGNLPQFNIYSYITILTQLEILIEAEKTIKLLYNKERYAKYPEIKSLLNVAFEEGWDKHAEKYKYTEEDMQKAITLAEENGRISMGFERGNFFTREELEKTVPIEDIINYIKNQKETQEIEFEEEAKTEYGPFQLKISKSEQYPNGLLTIKNINYES